MQSIGILLDLSWIINHKSVSYWLINKINLFLVGVSEKTNTTLDVLYTSRSRIYNGHCRFGHDVDYGEQTDWPMDRMICRDAFTANNNLIQF